MNCQSEPFGSKGFVIAEFNLAFKCVYSEFFLPSITGKSFTGTHEDESIDSKCSY